MNIYFSCSITGGRKEQKLYRGLVNYLLSKKYTVPTSRLADEDILQTDGLLSPSDIYLRDMEWLRNCDALIAEVSTPSHGVGYEIAMALTLEKPVLCCYLIGMPVSKIILGNNHPKLHLGEYHNLETAIHQVDLFLKIIEKKG